MLLLVGLAVLPLFGVAFVGFDQYRDVQSSQDLADEVRAGMEEVVWLERFRLALVDERNWTITRRAAEDAGIPLALIEQLTGLDMASESDAAVARADELLAEDFGPIVQDDVDGFRTLGFDDLFALDDAIEAVQDDIGARITVLRSELLQAAAAAPNGSQVVVAIRASDAASAARTQHARQLWAYVAAEFGEPGRAAPLYLELAEVRRRVDEALDLVMVVAPPTSQLGDAVDAVRASAQRQEFMDAIGVALAGAFETGGVSGLLTEEFVAQIQTSADVYRSGTAAVAVFDELVDAGNDLVDDAVLGSVNEASDRFRTTMTLLAVVAGISVAIATVLARYVGAPMIRLADAAKRLGTGDAIELERRGPHEVRRVTDALETAAAGLALVERLEHEATHDELTGVATRRPIHTSLDRSLAKARRTGATIAVMFIDIDHFKDINDTHGHAVGDVVLATVAARLGRELRLGDDLGRFGGDEFVAIADPVEDAAAAVELAERLLRVAAQPVDVTSANADLSPETIRSGVAITLSIGVAITTGGPMAATDVLRRADEAVYEAKAGGRNRVVLATPSPSAEPPGEPSAEPHRSLGDTEVTTPAARP
ncbi:MAG: GGDEF domain-containing protein [Actinomycetota bacterium]